MAAGGTELAKTADFHSRQHRGADKYGAELSQEQINLLGTERLFSFAVWRSFQEIKAYLEKNYRSTNAREIFRFASKCGR